jgi:hypothetical protein
VVAPLLRFTVVKEESDGVKEKLVLQEPLIAEPEVSSKLVGLIVVEDIIAIDCPAASNPLMNALIEDALSRQLVFNLLLRRGLELCVNRLHMVMVVLVMMVVMPT